MDANGCSNMPSVLRHDLPAGIQSVRRYGLLSPNGDAALDAVSWLMTLHNKAVFTLLAAPEVEPGAKPAPRCPVSRGLMAILRFVPALAPAVFDTS
jgi:hypothetical protein